MPAEPIDEHFAILEALSGGYIV
ncbi:hypothetical protein OOU_Y34scaffold00773g17 [Pyricularia oryzae Y34]|uniref:Uncharacterized protein n=2 Tax=Pyricularia oryzae TaxID=318829 RepID=A0AA97NQA0_PYRO3|nr:hypothetical protein OOU_Y34scaffold00773g17 [Pyricularia oryzae Y34]